MSADAISSHTVVPHVSGSAKPNSITPPSRALSDRLIIWCVDTSPTGSRVLAPVIAIAAMIVGIVGIFFNLGAAIWYASLSRDPESARKADEHIWGCLSDLGSALPIVPQLVTTWSLLFNPEGYKADLQGVIPEEARAIIDSPDRESVGSSSRVRRGDGASSSADGASALCCLFGFFLGGGRL